MSKFWIVKQESDIDLNERWQRVTSKKDIVSIEGKSTFKTDDARRYQVIAKYHLPYSLKERILRVVEAIFVALLTLGLVFIMRGARQYFTAKNARSFTFVVQHGKVVVPLNPDPQGKKYPIDSQKYIDIALTLDTDRIRKSLDKISDNSLNKKEITKDMLLAILQNINIPIGMDRENAKNEMNRTCLAVAELLKHGVDLKSNFITIASESPFETTNKQFPSFLDVTMQSVLQKLEDLEDSHPLFNLLLENGAQTRLEIEGTSHNTVTELTTQEFIKNIRREIALIKFATKILLPATVDEESSLHVLPKEILHLVGENYVKT